MAFFALLFAMTPGLEAMACAAEGCDPVCSERVVETSVSSEKVPGSETCVEAHCICAASHCNHVAIAAREVAAGVQPVDHARAAPVPAEQPLSITPQTPERPPRA